MNMHLSLIPSVHYSADSKAEGMNLKCETMMRAEKCSSDTVFQYIQTQDGEIKQVLRGGLWKCNVLRPFKKL